MFEKVYKVIATYETTVSVSQAHDDGVCDEHTRADDEGDMQWEARMNAIDACEACDQKAWEEAYNEAYDKFSDADDIELI